MGRYYRFKKAVEEEDANKIIAELNELDDVEKASLEDSNTCLLVSTKDDDYTKVMIAAVNICSRIAGVEISFDRFDY